MLNPDARYEFSGEELERLLGEMAGATSGVFLREDPTKVMPSQQVEIAMREFIDATPESFEALDPEKVRIGVSLEGAKSFCSDSAGWGAIGLQEITEGLEGQLAARGITPPFKPGP
jgi:hypothetical protein